MRKRFRVAVIIPALNEAETIGVVLDAIPAWVDLKVVADNGSSDNTSKIAASHGARVVHETRLGYGAACLRAMKEVPSLGAADNRTIVVFLDGDCSDNPDETASLVDPIIGGQYHFVLGSRMDGLCEPGALSTAQRFGSYLASLLMKVLYDVNFSDLGPFRAVRWDKLKEMRMDDLDFGWTVQMQIRAAKIGMRILEVPVSYRNRAGGKSKVSGTIRGVWGAGTTILKVIFKEAFDNTQGGRRASKITLSGLGRRVTQWISNF